MSVSFKITFAILPEFLYLLQNNLKVLIFLQALHPTAGILYHENPTFILGNNTEQFNPLLA